MKRPTPIIAALLGVALAGAATAPPSFAPPSFAPFGIATAQALEVSGTAQRVEVEGSSAAIVKSIAATTKWDGTPVAVVPAGGSGGHFTIVDLNTHTALTHDPIDPKAGDVTVWGAVTLSNRDVVLATSNGGLYRVNPDSGKVTNLTAEDSFTALRDKGSFFFWDVTRDENDKLYIAAFNKSGAGHVLTYDTKAETNRWGDLAGPIHPDRPDARNVAYDGGTVYVATGGTGTEIFAINASTGAKTEIPLPAEVKQSGEFTHLEAHGGKLYANSKAGACNATCVLDAKTGQKETTLSNFQGAVTVRPGVDNKVYYHENTPSAQRLVEYDPATQEKKPVANMSSYMLSRSSWANGDVVVASTEQSGGLSVVNAKTQQTADLPGDAIKTGNRSVQTLGLGPDGNIYGGFFMTSTQFLKINAAAAKGSIVGGMPNGQIEGMTTSGNKVVAGLYTDARLGVFDTSTQTWSNADRNIAGQDRPYTMADLGDGRVAVGTVPYKGTLGGAFAIYNVGSNTVEKVIQLNDVPELAGLSPVSMAYRDGKVYVGTSVRGGQGAANKKPEAKIFAYDVAAGRITGSAALPNKPTAVNALTFGDDGKLYGIADSHIHEFNPATLQAQRSHSLGGGKEENRSQLHFRGGVLYALMGGKIRAVSAGNFADNTVVQGVDNGDGKGVDSLAMDKDGNLFYAQSDSVFKLAIK